LGQVVKALLDGNANPLLRNAQGRVEPLAHLPPLQPYSQKTKSCLFAKRGGTLVISAQSVFLVF
jgi:hypothetical protein